jgi:hypothetical protein
MAFGDVVRSDPGGKAAAGRVCTHHEIIARFEFPDRQNRSEDLGAFTEVSKDIRKWQKPSRMSSFWGENGQRVRGRNAE